MDTKLNIDVISKDGEIVIRTGTAPNIITPSAVNISGLITAPADYYRAKKAAAAEYFTNTKATVIVNREKCRIYLSSDLSDPLGTSITGELSGCNELSAFKINWDYRWNPTELAGFLRKNRMYFSDMTEGMHLIKELQTVKIDTKGEIIKSNDNRGNTKNSISQSIESNIPLGFTLNIPAFKGSEPIRFYVEIYLELSGSSLSCTLESFELQSTIQASVSQIIDEQLAPFIEDGIPIVEQ